MNKYEEYLGKSDNEYFFTQLGYNLFVKESTSKMPISKVEEYDNELNKVLIEGIEIFWPTNISDTALPWLYHEVFDEFSMNPSSYDHPNLVYDSFSWIIDAGCCEGYFSIFARKKNKTSLLIAFEPLREMKTALRKTFEMDLANQSMVLIEKALGKERDKLKFFSGEKHLCDSKLCQDSGNSDNTYDVEVVKLDDIAKELNLNGDGFIKMDIEGAEMDALLGAEQLLKQHKPKLAIAVYHEYENALRCKEIILQANPEYTIELRGMYCYYEPPRPYMLFAW